MSFSNQPPGVGAGLPSQASKLTRKMQQFTTSGTFYPSAALMSAGGLVDIDYIVGAGGGAGGIDATANNASGAGAGGQVKKNIRVKLTSSAPVTVTIGTGGTGGTTAGTAGAVGGDTTFGSYATAWGGGSGCGITAAVQKGLARWGTGGGSGVSNSGSGAGSGGPPTAGNANVAFVPVIWQAQVDTYTSNPSGLKGGYIGGFGGFDYVYPGVGIDGFGRGGLGVGNLQGTAPFAASVPTANSGNGGNGVGGSGTTARAGSNGADGFLQISWWE